jgi:hypothetical protein
VWMRGAVMVGVDMVPSSFNWADRTEASPAALTDLPS